MRFTQVIRVRCSDPDALLQLQAEWDPEQSKSEIMGYIRTRLLADRDRPGDYMMLADFAEVDGDLTAADEAEPNNRREAMERWAEKLRVLVGGETSRVAFLQESLGTVGGVIRCHQILGQVGYVLRFEPPP